MSSPLKRTLSSANRSVSPPAVRRRVFKAADAEATTTATDSGSSKPTAGQNLTFYSWNVNGIAPLLQKQISFSPPSHYPLRTFLRDHGWPYFLCLQEVKINCNDATTKRRVGLAANSGGAANEPTYTTHFSLPRDKYNATGFGGKVHGVATLIRDDAPVSTVTVPSFDLEGRVLIHEFACLPLTVVNGYWVNGTSNPYRNPTTGKVEGTRHDHKLRFHKHMLELCKHAESRGRHLLLLGDMNVAPQRIDGHPNLRTSPVQHVANRADFNTKFLDPTNDQGLRAVDLFRHFHGHEKKYTYRGRTRPWGESADRVDLIIANTRLVDSGAVTASDICDTPKDRGHSDHVPLWVEIDVGKLENAEKPRLGR